MNVFYKNFLALCAKKNKSPTSVAIAVGLSNAAAHGWKSGKRPSDVTLEKLSKYFGVSISDLTQELHQAHTPEAELKPGVIQITTKSSTEKEIIDIVCANADDEEALRQIKKVVKAILDK